MLLLLPLAASFENPLLWAVLVGWILSVVLHEFAHGIVAYWGGDYTIRERGGLTLNPIQYVDPLFSIIIPAVILLIGGIPLPGGATYIHRELIRNRFWDTAVSLAGPAMNLILCALCLIPLHPAVGWVNFSAGPAEWSNAQIFLATMGMLQFISVILNLVPVPPLDGFQAIAPYLPDEWRLKVSTPPISHFLFFAYFMVLWRGDILLKILELFLRLLHAAGFGVAGLDFFIESYRMALFE